MQQGCLIHRSPLQPLLLACPHLYLLQYLVILPPADPTCQRQVPTVNEHPSIVIIYYLPTIVVYVNAVCSGAPHNTIEGSSGKKTFVDWVSIPIVDCCIRTYAYFTHSLSAATAFKEADVDCCVSVPTGVCTIKYHILGGKLVNNNATIPIIDHDVSIIPGQQLMVHCMYIATPILSYCCCRGWFLTTTSCN